MKVSLLEDFIDEEVVDNKGKTLGILSCFWEAEDGLIFLGVQPSSDERVHVVPGTGATIDEPHSIIQLGFPGALVRTAPVFDCDREMRPRLEEAANEHFGASSLDAEES